MIDTNLQKLHREMSKTKFKQTILDPSSITHREETLNVMDTIWVWMQQDKREEVK